MKRRFSIRYFLMLQLMLSLFLLALLQPVSAQTGQWVLQKGYILSWYASPYGRLTGIFDMYKLDEGSTSWDWYLIKVRIQTVPGKYVYGSDWRTDYTWSYNYIRYYYSYQYLLGYAPTTTTGTQTSGWTFNLGIGVAGKYPVPLPSGGWVNYWTSSDVQVKDMGDFVSHGAHWWNEINEGANVGMYTYLSEAAYIVMTYNGYSLGIYFSFGVRWLLPQPWPYPTQYYTVSISGAIWYP